MKTMLLSGFASLVLLGGIAQAQQGPGDHVGMLERADADHDGYVSRQEFLDARARQFTRLDRNQDGFIDASDIPERLKERSRAMQRMNAMLQRFDTDHDGRVTAQEFAHGPTPEFDKADTNGDGTLSRSELDAAKERARARFEELRKQHPAPTP